MKQTIGESILGKIFDAFQLVDDRTIDRLVMGRLKAYSDAMSKLKGIERAHGVPVKLPVVAMILFERPSSFDHLNVSVTLDMSKNLKVESVSGKLPNMIEKTRADKQFCSQLNVSIVERGPFHLSLKDRKTSNLFSDEWNEKTGYSQRTLRIGKFISLRTGLRDVYSSNILEIQHRAIAQLSGQRDE